MTEKTYKYSEIFYSFQGEGHYTGKPTAWIRFFLCNLQCDGFGQKDPTDPSTYVLPYKDFDITPIKRIEDLPVWEYGCDSSYTWAKKYRHLAKDESAELIAQNIFDQMKHETNPEGLFRHPQSLQDTHMAFTGGEPMLNQPAMIAIMEAFYKSGNIPMNVTVETNGTKKLKPEMYDMIEAYRATHEFGGSVHDDLGPTEWFWSCSPKLLSTSGELPKKAIKPEFLAEYAEVGSGGQLKYVVNGTPQSWDEVEEHTAAFRAAGIDWPVYIMPVGATKEEQETDQIAEIAVEAMKRGYYFSGRLHCYVFGNQIGT
jgi:organic radical activating enzyme